MPVPIPIIIGGAVATAAGATAAYQLLKSDDDEDDERDSSRSSSSHRSSSSKNSRSSRNTGHKAKDRQQSALRRLRLTRNEEAQDLAERHGIDLPDNHRSYRRDCPGALASLFRNRRRKRKKKLKAPLNSIDQHIDELKKLRRQAEELRK